MCPLTSSSSIDLMAAYMEQSGHLWQPVWSARSMTWTIHQARRTQDQKQEMLTLQQVTTTAVHSPDG